jgi:small subunit ribosomal protein S19e
MRQNIGVGQFRRQYGGRNKRKGTVPEHYARASGGLIRHILKQLEARARPAAALGQRRSVPGQCLAAPVPGCVCAAGSTETACA